MKKVAVILAIAIVSLSTGCVQKELQTSGEINIQESENKYNQNRIKEIDEILNDKYMILANKDNLLGSDYIPSELVKSEIPFQSYIVTRDLERLASEKASEMFNAAKEDGINLLGASGYRSYDIQFNMYQNKVAQVGAEKAGEYLAPPGASEHQTGLALDILSTNYGSLNEGFEDTEASKWLVENSYKYGFILRYLEDKVDITKYEYEPWHYRYVGQPMAEEIMNKGICLEEYIENLKQEKRDLERIEK